MRVLPFRRFIFDRSSSCRRLSQRAEKKARRQFSTYYDSQSGLHVPVHNEDEISLILDKSREERNISTFVPAQLYKEDSASSDMSGQLQELKSLGIRGVILPPIRFPRDIRNLETLCEIAPKEFVFFASSGSGKIGADPSLQSVVSSPSVSMMLDYPSEENADNGELESTMQRYVQGGTNTTISLRDVITSGSIGPIDLANSIATLMDKTGGANYVWVSGTDDDDMFQICEELNYLDVEGPTVKSRLIVDFSSGDDLVFDTMDMGVNKFVIDNTQQIDTVEEISKEQKKQICDRLKKEKGDIPDFLK